jgi:hypothetical protein
MHSADASQWSRRAKKNKMTSVYDQCGCLLPTQLPCRNRVQARPAFGRASDHQRQDDGLSTTSRPQHNRAAQVAKRAIVARSEHLHPSMTGDVFHLEGTQNLRIDFDDPNGSSDGADARRKDQPLQQILYMPEVTESRICRTRSSEPSGWEAAYGVAYATQEVSRLSELPCRSARMPIHALVHRLLKPRMPVSPVPSQARQQYWQRGTLRLPGSGNPHPHHP